MELPINYFFDHLNQLSAFFFIAAFFFAWLRKLLKKSESENDDLNRMIAASMGSGAIPISFALFICAFDSSYLQRLEGVNIHIGLAGAALLFAAITSIKQNL